MRIYQTRWFERFARRERISADSLSDAITRAENGLIDANLGGNLIKLRVARRGRGRSGGYRLLAAFRSADRAVFLYGFAKNERENIEADELVTLKELAAVWLEADTTKIAKAIEDGILFEVKDED